MSAAISSLALFAASEAAGKRPEGPMITGYVVEGQTLEVAFILTPGKCYTALAAGIGLADIESRLMLASPIPGMSATLANNTSLGASASIGGKGNCYKWSAPLASPGRFVVKARLGSGFVAAQLYAK